MDELNSELRQGAISLGLCQQWQSQWDGSCSQWELIEKYKRGMDFCIKHDYPDKDYIKRNFDKEILNANLIFVDEHLDFGDKRLRSGTYVLLGECTGTLKFDHWATATIFVRHKSNVKVESTRFAAVFVRTYEQAEVTVETDGRGKVKVLHR